MKKTHITDITVSTKKGHEQKTRWLVSQARPFPDVHGVSGLEWRNAGQLIPKYGNTQLPTLGNTYYCQLLRSDYNPETATGNRNGFAGFSPDLVYKDGVRVMEPDLPGAIELRGKSLGEMEITFGNNPEWPDIKVRGYNGVPTTTERDWIKAAIVPTLRQFITDNAASLKAEAVAELKKDTTARLASYRADLGRMEKQMGDILAKL